ncbi:hypothetical protein SCANM63S_06655 [Streptomyces canarius]
MARAERLDRRQVVRVVRPCVLVEPAQRGRVGHRGPEVEAVRQGRRREVVAAREAAAGVGAAGGQRVVRQVRLRLLGRHRLQGHVVQPAAELRRAVGGVVRHQDAVDGLAGRDRADPRGHVVPLVDVQGLRRALPARGEREAVLVQRAQAAQIGAVGEGQVDGDVGGVVVAVAVGHRREDAVRQLGVAADPDVHVEDLVVRIGPAGRRVPAGVAQGALSGEPGARLGGRRAARALVDQGQHVLRHRTAAAAGGELHIGELEDVRGARVLRHLQPEVLVLGRLGEVVRLRLEPLGEVLARAGVDRLPVLAVGGALQGPVLGVALAEVIGRGERVRRYLHGLVQVELHPAGGLEGQPLGAGLAVDEVLLDLAGAGVLAAGPDFGDMVGDIARNARAVAAVDARGALGAVPSGVDGVQPVRRRVARLERGCELPVGRRSLAGQGDRRALRADGHDKGGREDDRRAPSVPRSPLHLPISPPAPPPDNVVSYGAQEPVGGQVARDVKGVGCGIQGVMSRIFPAGRSAGPSYFREVSTRKRPHANPAFDLAQLAGSGLYLSAFPARASTTRQRCRGGSGSPPESWRRRGLEHGIQRAPRRRRCGPS